LIDGRNICSFNALSDILILDKEVLAYSTFNASYCHVLVIDCFEVFALAFLYKGNTSVINVNNAAIKLEVVSGNETFTFLNQKPGLL
jgi:hypothetical protein